MTGGRFGEMVDGWGFHLLDFFVCQDNGFVHHFADAAGASVGRALVKDGDD
jgi:hypothetical protein